ncbi:MAG: glycosyltransferase family 1 protein [Acidobacteriaceae bacterium]
MRTVGRLTGHLWEQLELPLFSRGQLLFTPSGGAPVLHNRNVITIQDAAPFSTPHAYSAAYRTYYKTLERVLARSALHVITGSEFAKRELIRFLPLESTRISVTPLSGEHILREPPDRGVFSRLNLPPEPYILAVASRNPNKNIAALETAFERIEEPGVWMALAGGANPAVFARHGAPGASVRQLGTVTDGELRSLYENAACFVFPSLYEGFGLPPLEALTVGCPVIVARAASLPEVFGEAAVYCDPSSVQDICSSIVSVLRGKRLGPAVQLEKAREYTWARCALQTWSVLSGELARMA